MRAIQRFAISRPVTTAMFYLGLVLMGLISFTELEVNLLPELQFPKLTIITAYKNASPEEVENLITRPISESIGAVSGVEKVYSESLEGLSFITLQFKWGVNLDYAVMGVRERIDIIRGLLPQDANRSVISRFDPGEDPFMEIVFFSRGLTRPDDLRHLIQNDVKIYLDRIDGVAYVQLTGGFKKEVQIEVDQKALNAFELSFDQIRQSIEATNVNVPAGSITVGSRDVLIRTVGEYSDVKDIARTVVGRNKSGVPVLLSDVAVVRDGYRERKGLARYNGNEAVIVSLRRESGKNTVQVAKQVRKELEMLREMYREDLDIRIVYDESRFVNQSISNITRSLIIGSVLAFFALVLILRNLQSPVILVTVLPVSLLTTIILMFLGGLSLNMMTLGGMALGIGMLFDSGNVVLSSIERHAITGLTLKEASLRGAQEVVGSITAAILTTVIVFLPIVFLKSVVGIVFAEMAMTITFSLLVSLFVSLTLIPMLYSIGILSKWRDLSDLKIVSYAARIEHKVEGAYARRLSDIIQRPRKLFLTLLLLLIFALAAFIFVKREFVPTIDTGEFSIVITGPRGSTIKATERTVVNVEQFLMENALPVEHIISRLGYDPDEVLTLKGGNIGTHRAIMRVILLEDRDLSANEVVEEMRSRFQLREDIQVDYDLSGDVITRLLSPDSRPISLELTGEDLDILKDYGRRIKDDVGAIPGSYDVRASLEEQSKEINVFTDSLRLAEAGLDNARIAQYLRTAIDGDVVTKLRFADEEVDVRIRLSEDDRDTLSDMNYLTVYGEQNGDRTRAHITQLTRFDENLGQSSISRSGPLRLNRITGNIQEGRHGEILGKIEEYLSSLQLPTGYSISFSGEVENIKESFRELFFAFILAAILIYMLLSSQFESLLYSLLMMGTIPMIIIGVFPALAFTGKSLNVSSFTGLILLVGVVVDNAALFYEYVHILRSEGMALKSAIEESCKIILRPVIMNNATTVLALLPVALELGEGTEFQSPMATAVISGLLTSVVISLFFIPTIFYNVMKRREQRVTR